MTSHEIFDNHFNNALERFNSAGCTIVGSFCGVLDDEKVNEFSFGIETKMLELGEKKGFVKRVFSILIEALQNIHLHGEKDSSGKQSSYVIVAKNSDNYFITFANLIFDENKPKVESRITYINGLSKDELKEYYMKVLTDGEMSKKGGAGLGFITIGMKSKNKMKYEFLPASEGLSLFALDSFLNLKESEG